MTGDWSATAGAPVAFPVHADGAEGETSRPPRVSVVVPFHDAVAFLEESVRSVFAQTFEDWELLLVDDASSDGSTELAAEIAAARPDRVRVLQHDGRENRGVSASRNLGVRHARGELVAFLDADDVWLPEKLTEQVQCLDAHPEAALVYGRIGYWYSWTGRPEDVHRDHRPDMGVVPDRLYSPPDLVVAMLEGTARTPLPSDALLRTAAMRECGGFEEDRALSVYEDRVLFVRLELAHAAYFADRCWTRYRQHASSSSTAIDQSSGRSAARRTFLDWMERHLLQSGYRNTHVWHLVLEQEVATGERIEDVARATSDRAAPVRALRAVARRVLPTPIRRALRRVGSNGGPPAGLVRFGDLRRVKPIGVHWGRDRGGLPIDRYYIERFLAAHAADVRGRVLEVGDDRYTVRFGGARVEHSDVLHVYAGTPGATIIDDLTTGATIPSDSFDCVILTQVVHMMAEPRAAVQTAHRILRPGGVLLMTCPGISQISAWDAARWGDFWRFTEMSARLVTDAAFGAQAAEVESLGNVLSAVSFLHGLAAQELGLTELEHRDPAFPVLVTVRATKLRSA
jgi:glycosyltransferase involved in cell wall biosynthesis